MGVQTTMKIARAVLAFAIVLHLAVRTDAWLTNIASRKHTWQTGIGWNGLPSRAVDGNRNTNWNGNSCTHTDGRYNPYWVVDLQRPTKVTGVSLTNRMDCCSNRLSDYDVVVTNTKPSGAQPHYNNHEICAYRAKFHSNTLNIRCYKPRTGRYVMVRLKQIAKQYLTLCEVQVYNQKLPTYWTKGDPLSLKNIAFRRHTQQTGIGWHGHSARAVDGNRNSQWRGASCTHTNLRQNPYWFVDLGRSSKVSGFSITNREDCCTDRLGNYDVVVTDTRPSGALPHYTLRQICARRRATHHNTLNVRCYRVLRGRYVMVIIRQHNTQYLTICELEVYSEKLPGSWIHGDPLSTLVNIAFSRPAFQTSIGWDGKPGRAVDGNQNSNWHGHSCTHTGFQVQPYWFVDLGRTYGVTGVSITNRQDCCTDRLRDYDVVVTNTRPHGQNPSYTFRNVCVHRRATHHGTLNLRCYRRKYGRYVMVRIRQQHKQYLTLCEVQVYNRKLPSDWPKGDPPLKRNSAYCRRTWQSGIGWDGQSHRAVDGNRDNLWKGASCTHTSLQYRPWWAVDLGATKRVTTVVITNRRDCCTGRLHNYDVVVTNKRPQGHNPRYNHKELCIHRGPTHHGTLILRCYKALYGRYVMVRICQGNKQYLTLCEVEVYG